MRNSCETIHDRGSNQSELSFYSDSVVNSPRLSNKFPLFDPPALKKQSQFRPSILPVSEIASGTHTQNSPWVSSKMFDFAADNYESPIHSSQNFSPMKKSKISENADSPSSNSSRGARKSTFHWKPRTTRPSRVLQLRQDLEKSELRVDVIEQNKKLEVRKKERRVIDLNEISRAELIELGIKILKKPKDQRSTKDILALTKCLLPVDFFKGNDIKTTQECFRCMYHVAYSTNQTVFEIDTIGKTFWILLKGSVGVWVYVKQSNGVNEKGEEIFTNVLTEVKTLSEGSSFGELALLENKKRAASIVCKEDCDFAVLNKEDFKAILKENETKKLYAEIDYLVSLPIFQTWSYNAVKKIYYNSRVEKYKRGQVLYEEDETAQKMYIVKSGSLKVFKQVVVTDENSKGDPLKKMKKNISVKKTVELGIISEKGIIGEEELLQGCKRKYRLVCHSLEAEVCEINKINFLERVLKNQQTKEWLEDYVKSKDKYYQTRLKSIQESTSLNNPLLAFSKTPKNSSQREDPNFSSSMSNLLVEKPAHSSDVIIQKVSSLNLNLHRMNFSHKSTDDDPERYRGAETTKNMRLLSLEKIPSFRVRSEQSTSRLRFAEKRGESQEKSKDNDEIFKGNMELKFYETPDRWLRLQKIQSKGSKELDVGKHTSNGGNGKSPSLRNLSKKIKQQSFKEKVYFPKSSQDMVTIGMSETDLDKYNTFYYMGEKPRASKALIEEAAESLNSILIGREARNKTLADLRDAKETQIDPNASVKLSLKAIEPKESRETSESGKYGTLNEIALKTPKKKAFDEKKAMTARPDYDSPLSDRLQPRTPSLARIDSFVPTQQNFHVRKMKYFDHLNFKPPQSKKNNKKGLVIHGIGQDHFGIHSHRSKREEKLQREKFASTSLERKLA